MISLSQTQNQTEIRGMGMRPTRAMMGDKASFLEWFCSLLKGTHVDLRGESSKIVR